MLKKSLPKDVNELCDNEFFMWDDEEEEDEDMGVADFVDTDFGVEEEDDDEGDTNNNDDVDNNDGDDGAQDD